jgi:hypothetical protein
LKQEKEEVLKQLRVTQYCVTAYENERDAFRVMFEEENVKIHREKEQLLTKQTAVKEVVNKALRSIPGLT